MASYAYESTLSTENLARYNLKKTVAGLALCPYKTPSGSWINNPTSWVNLEWPEVYDYLVNTPGKLRYYQFIITFSLYFAKFNWF